MKVKDFARLMNNQGTCPRIKVFSHDEDCALLVYEGKPESIDEAVSEKKVNSFTVVGRGCVDIHI